MPYVKRERRPALDKVVNALWLVKISNESLTNMLRVISGRSWTPECIPYQIVLDTIKEKEVKPNGDINYILFKYAKYHIKPSYNNYKDYIGTIQDAIDLMINYEAADYRHEYSEVIAEIRRRLLVPYEKEKILENGDV
jgi:hypothetical protein